MSRSVDIEFSLGGSCHQTIELYSSCSLTPEEVVRGLNRGFIRNSITGGDVMDYSGRQPKAIGRIVHQNFEGDFDCFANNGEDA